MVEHYQYLDPPIDGWKDVTIAAIRLPIGDRRGITIAAIDDVTVAGWAHDGTLREYND